MNWDQLFINATLFDVDLKTNQALAVQAGRIAWMGPMQELSGDPQTLSKNVQDIQGRLLTPGLIDCHTHVVFGGNRAHEFALRAKGASYADIAKQGGGIQATVGATRELSEDELLAVSLPRVQALMESGVTTLEIKSGYGLDFETEMKMLRVAKRIGETLPVDVISTFLGAHTFPLEYKGREEVYVKMLCEEMIPAVAELKLAQAVDVFSESIAFNLEQTEAIFTAATRYGLRVKSHAEQLSASGAAELAARFKALSVDHLEYLTEAGVAAIKASGTVAVLLPGAAYFLRETHMPPIAALRAAKVPMAVATDCNPGTSPLLSLVTAMNMAVTLFRLTPEEALLGATQHAALALGLADRGSLKTGLRADLAVWDVSSVTELLYYLGRNSLLARFQG